MASTGGSAAAVSAISDSTTDEGRFLPGLILADRYRIVSLLGAGGMGEVYRATDLKLGQAVALKFVPASAPPETLARFRAEVRVARQISHPNVCRVYDIAEYEGQHFLSMEYIDGENLSSLLRRIGRLPHDKALDIARQICAGVAAAHDKGVLHRDLKPANVLVDSRGVAHIADFGLAAAEEIRAGTPLYMAPEQYAGREVTVRSDIYSLGLVLYELFTGRRAHNAQSQADLQALHQSTPASLSQFVHDVDSAVERAILQCLEPDPALRPSSALSVAAALPGGDPLAAALAAGETPSPGLVAAAGEAIGIQPRAAAALFAACALAIGAGWWIQAATQSLNEIALDKPPEVLESRAREIARALGHPRQAHSAHGLAYSGSAIRHRNDKDPNVRFPVLGFWYRESPTPMLNYNPIEAGLVVGTVLPEQPRMGQGEFRMTLDPDGRLRALIAVTPESAADIAKRTVDWNQALVSAGLEPEHYKTVEPQWLPDVPTDQRMAWLSTDPERWNVETRVEAGALGGKVVWFRTIPPWVKPATPTPTPKTTAQQVTMISSMVILTALVAAGAFMARRHLKAGRGDQRGATRIASVVFVLHMAAYLLGSDHAADPSVVAVAGVAAAMGLLKACVLWMAYVALEPFARRRWPHVMISWSRLLGGRWRDPLLSRDILLGLSVGALVHLVLIGNSLLPRWFGKSSFVPNADVDLLLGLTHSAANLLNRLSVGFIQALALFLLFFLIRLLTRRDWIGVAVTAIVAVIPNIAQSSTPLMTAVLIASGVAVLFGTLVRVGLTAFAIALFTVNTVATIPATLDFNRWYAQPGLVLYALFGLAAAWTFRGALAGRRLLPDA